MFDTILLAYTAIMVTILTLVRVREWIGENL